MQKILSTHERLALVKSPQDLVTQLNEALRTLQLVQQECRRKLPMELKHTPNAVRMIPELHKRVSRAKNAYEMLRSNFHRYNAMLKQNKPVV